MLVGCGTKSAVNIKNYNKLQYWMNYNEVKKILVEGEKKVVKIIKTWNILLVLMNGTMKKVIWLKYY